MKTNLCVLLIYYIGSTCWSFHSEEITPNGGFPPTFIPHVLPFNLVWNTDMVSLHGEQSQHATSSSLSLSSTLVLSLSHTHSPGLHPPTPPSLICTWEPCYRHPRALIGPFNAFQQGATVVTRSPFSLSLTHTHTHTLVNNTLCGWWENEVCMNVRRCVCVCVTLALKYTVIKAKDESQEHDSEKRSCFL